ncbi:lipoyltransferase [Panaeolus papilionaceus]|nr:lipoyltransferase [Panaeolus papilionaceus]
MSNLVPVYYHVFAKPVPYLLASAAQDAIHRIQLNSRNKNNNSNDILLLLEHRPTYTAGRRQLEEELSQDRTRLQRLGADFVSASRGGQLTYHGPGQIVGYPLIDLSTYTPTMGARDYVCRIQKLLQAYLRESHDIPYSPSEHTGVFLDPHTKIASIGVQIRHRLTSHGFAINVTSEPLPWFNQIVACGLDNVKAGSIQSCLNNPTTVAAEHRNIIHHFGEAFGRDMLPFNPTVHSEIGQIVAKLERSAEEADTWPTSPDSLEP